MRTTITLEENLVRELIKFFPTKTKTAAVNLAVREQIRRAKLSKLADLLGTVTIDESAIQESNALDMKRAEWLETIGEKTEK